VSDIDTAMVVDSLKALDPKRPIREADIGHLVDHLMRFWFVTMSGVVDDVKYIRATIERFEGGRWRSRTTCRSGGEAPLGPRVRQLLPTTQRNLLVRPFGGGGHVFRIEIRQPARATFRRTPPMSAYPPISTRV